MTTVADSNAVAHLQHAARQAWVGLWHGLMRDAGGVSRLPFDATVVADALAPKYDRVRFPPVPHRGVSEWARQLEGDERISGITLAEVIVGLDDYFRIFRQIRKHHRPAYEYFSRVGVPLCFDNMSVLTRHILPPAAVVDAADLPSYIGVFMTRDREQARAAVMDQRPAFLDFQLYEKRRRNMRVVSPWKWTLYDHAEFALDRDVFTKAERRRFPEAGEWGFHYYIGIDARGVVSALPMQMTSGQTLKSGDVVHHNRFVVPPGLSDMSRKMKDGYVGVDGYVAAQFAAIRAFAASALSGVQLSVRRGDEVARFGIPLAYVRSFFRDREREGSRRRPLLHLVAGYEYERGNRRVAVGEHLRGARRFAWRGHDILITAPGLHHAAPETLTAELLTDEDILPLPRDVVSVSDVAADMRTAIDTSPPVRFRRGEPSRRYRLANMGLSDEALRQTASS